MVPLLLGPRTPTRWAGRGSGSKKFRREPKRKEPKRARNRTYPPREASRKAFREASREESRVLIVTWVPGWAWGCMEGRATWDVAVR